MMHLIEKRKEHQFRFGLPPEYARAEGIIWQMVAVGEEIREEFTELLDWWPTDHHMVARYLCDKENYPEHAYRASQRNSKLIDWGTHKAWHTLWGIYSPGVVLALIAEVLAPEHTFEHVRYTCAWEDSQYTMEEIDPQNREFSLPICSRSWNKVFADASSWIEVMKVVILEWSPADYFLHVDIKDKHGQHLILTTKEYPG